MSRRWTTADVAAVLKARGVANPLETACGAPPSAKPNKMPRARNKWEESFGELLELRRLGGEIIWYQFEAMRFRLADGAYYKPDWMAMLANQQWIAFEVKGMWREAARLRIKVAADQHPIKFCAVRKRKVSEGGGWDEEWFSAAFDRIIGGIHP
jgi:hypothetical protein